MNLKPYIAPAVVVIVAAGAIYLSDRDVKGPSGLSLVRNADEYQALNHEVRDLTLAPLVALDNGEEITKEQRADLERSIPKIEAMNAYAPIKVGPFFTLGKVQMALGSYAAAGYSFEQSILNEPADSEERNTPALQATVIEAKALLSECLLQVAVDLRSNAAALSEAEKAKTLEQAKKYEKTAVQWASEAVAARPQEPHYLADLGAAYLATGHEKEARNAVLAAQSYDPRHPKVVPLVKLMGL